MDPEWSTLDYVNVDNPNARYKLLNLMIDVDLVDCWRYLNVKARQYTWRKKNTNKRARLDFFLNADEILAAVDDTKIMPGYKTDHFMVLLRKNLINFKKDTPTGYLIIVCCTILSMYRK